MSGAIPLFHQYAFMVWCSVKAQGKIYLYLVSIDKNKTYELHLYTVKPKAYVYTKRPDNYVE
jgi:hypothetical protein